MTNCLFVYGTLMRSATTSDLGRDMRERLEQEAEWLGPATIPGQLYDLGEYPGLGAPMSQNDWVFGEVWRVSDTAVTFAWLDLYEGIESGCVRGEDYERVVRTVTLADGTGLEAFTYLYVADRVQKRLIASGIWRPPNDCYRRAGICKPEPA